MICNICKEEKSTYNINNIDGSTIFSICPGCFSEIILDNGYIINMLKMIIPKSKANDLEMFIERVLNENEKNR